MRRGLGVAALATGLLGCGISQVAPPDPAAIPTGEPRKLEGMPDPIGEESLVGAGRSLEVGWRYWVYDSEEGLCTHLELVTVSTSGCGDLQAAPGEIFGGVNHGASLEGAVAAEGLVSEEVAAVIIRTTEGGDFPATLMSLDPAGLDGKAFVGFVPPNQAVAQVIAIDEDGGVIETFDLGRP